MSVTKFSLNLDGTLTQRASVSERGEDQPGLYSPRPSTTSPSPPSASTAATTTSSTNKATASSPLSAPSSSSASAPGRQGPQTALHPLKKHADPMPTVAEAVAAEEAAIGITDPDMDVILSAKSRLTGSPDRSSSGTGRSLSPPVGGIAGGGSAALAAAASLNLQKDDPDSSSRATSGDSGSGTRKAVAALATLVEHQNARQQSPGALAVDARGKAPTSPHRGGGGGGGQDGSSSAQSSSPSRGGGMTSGSRAPSLGSATGGGTNSSSAAAARSHRASSQPADGGARVSSSSSSEVTTVCLEEAYILGRTFRQFVKSTSRLSINGITGKDGGGAAFRQNPTQYISAIASSGDYVAVGDRTGHVAVLKRRPMSAAQRRGLLEEEKREDAKWLADGGGLASSSGVLGAGESPAPRTRDVYDFHVGQQAYTSVIDPLNSVEVTPNVSALAFLPTATPAAYLLTANEKVPKLYKVMSVRESAKPFRAVDKIDSKTIGPLTAASRESTVVMKPIARYALSHEYNIHSICPVADAEQFVTADDLTMQLWCTEYPDTSVETYDIRPPYDEEPREAVRCVRAFPHEPFLLFAVTSAGNVRVIDVRQTLRWVGQTPQLFVNPPREADGNFSNVTNSLSDCALSPCGRYIAGRDFMTVCLWDVRVAGNASSTNTNNNGGRSAFPGSPTNRTAAASAAPTDYSIVQRWELHPSLRDHLETLYQSDLLFERFDVQFLNNQQVCTGGFGNSLYTINVTQPECGNSSTLQQEPPRQRPSAGVRVVNLPTSEGAVDVAKTTLRSKPALLASAVTAGVGTGGANTLELGSRVTLLSRPAMSLGGACGMMVTCGQVVMQLSYKL